MRERQQNELTSQKFRGGKIAALLTVTLPIYAGVLAVIAAPQVYKAVKFLYQALPAYINPRVGDVRVRFGDNDGDGRLETNLDIDGEAYLLQEDSDSKGYTLKRYSVGRE